MLYVESKKLHSLDILCLHIQEVILLLSLTILTSPLLDPLKDTTTILIGAMVLGFIQLVTGMIVNMVMECRQGKVLPLVVVDRHLPALFSKVPGGGGSDAP